MKIVRDPRVLVSPSMSEGVDLPYEKCQFQVIYKIPFPYLGDPQINQRKQQDPSWYAYKTIMTLLQAYGRGMRAEDDYCETYILDGNFRMLLRKPTLPEPGAQLLQGSQITKEIMLHSTSDYIKISRYVLIKTFCNKPMRLNHSYV